MGRQHMATPMRTTLLAAILAATSLASANAASGTSSNGGVAWTTGTNGTITGAGIRSETFPNAASPAIQSTTNTNTYGDTLTTVAGWRSGFLGANTTYNGGQYRPSGTFVNEDVIFSNNNVASGNTTTPGYLDVTFKNPLTYWGAMVNFYGGKDVVGTVTVYNKGTQIIQQSLAGISTFVTAGDTYAAYLNLTAYTGYSFDEVRFNYSAIQLNKTNIGVAVVEMVDSSTYDGGAKPATAEVPEPALLGLGALVAVGMVGSIGRRARRSHKQAA